jgi:hypothetical protein
VLKIYEEVMTQKMVIVNKEIQSDGTHSLSVTWTGMSEDELEEKLFDLSEFEGDWPEDSGEIIELAKS